MSRVQLPQSVPAQVRFCTAGTVVAPLSTQLRTVRSLTAWQMQTIMAC